MAAKPSTGNSMENRLRASLARDVEIRVKKEDAKKQGDYLAIARWENALGVKDKLAANRRYDESVNIDSLLAKGVTKRQRVQKLEALYKEDEKKYGRELCMQKVEYRKVC